MNPSSTREGLRRGFTIIELLTVVTIIAILAGLILPVTQNIMTKAYDTQCVNNLRQIGIAANAAATDNDNIYPIVEIDPSGTMVQDTLGLPAKPIDQALAPYGITPKVLQCPADIKGPTNDYAKYNTSYMWSPFSEENNASVPSIISRRRGQTQIPPSRLQLCSDWDAVHYATDGNYGTSGGKMMYFLYGDGHVRTTRRVKPKP